MRTGISSLRLNRAVISKKLSKREIRILKRIQALIAQGK